MSNIQYKTLSDLAPIKLNYTYNTAETLQDQYISYNTGLNIHFLNGTNSYQDISFNNETCLILTSAVNLKDVFLTKIFENNFFGSVLLKPRNSNIYYVTYNTILNTLDLSLSGTQIYIAPVSGTNEVELFIEKKYLQVEVEYPYNVFLSEKSLDPESIYRQRFTYNLQNNTITFKTKTNTGDRYIGFDTDNVLRATGCILNESVLNDYVFIVEYVAVNTGEYGFIPNNDYITYYFDFENTTNNKNVTINKTFNDNPNNFLLSFTFNDINKNDNSTNMNIANLKNIVTPAGGIATIDNSYSKLPTTTN